MADINICGGRESLINRENNKVFNRCVSHQEDELHSFRKYLRWMCVDHSSLWTTILSWTMFVVFTLVVPAISHFLLACADCDSYHSRPYDSVVQLSLSSVATVSFLCLTRFVSKYGLRRFLFFDKLWDESETVRRNYTNQLNIDSDVGSILSEHLRIRRHLRIISHRYRSFILCLLILVTGSQFSSLLITTKAYTEVNIYRAGELALCSMTLVTALLILLRSASKITHKAQAVTCLAAKWHVCATLESFETADGETPTLVARNNIDNNNKGHDIITLTESDSEDYGDEEDDLDNNNIIPAYAFSTISFQKRQALVGYFENNRAGITVYGFTLDRGTLHTIFGLELSLVLWLLGKTIGIS